MTNDLNFILNCHYLQFTITSKKQESSKETSTSALLTTAKPLTVRITKKTEKFFIRIPGHLICLLRNMYVGQEATVRTGQGTTD